MILRFKTKTQKNFEIVQERKEKKNLLINLLKSKKKKELILQLITETNFNYKIINYIMENQLMITLKFTISDQFEKNIFKMEIKLEDTQVIITKIKALTISKD